MKNCRLWYKEPAEEWVKALPIGNGRIGAVVYGGVSRELIQLNEDSLWSGYPTQWYNPEVADTLYPVREKMLQDERLEAQKLIEDKMVGQWSQSYLPLADAQLQFDNEEEFQTYSRELDMSTGIVKSQYDLKGGYCKREAFVSSTDDVLIYRISAQNAVNFTITMDSPIRHQTRVKEDQLLLSGVAPSYVVPHYIKSDEPVIYGESPEEKGMRFCSLMKVTSMDGQVVVTPNSIEVKGTKEATIYISMATSFNGRDRHPYIDGIDEVQKADDIMNQALSRDIEALKNDHIVEHQKIFGKMDFDIKDQNRSAIPTDERLAANRASMDDVSLIPLAFQYGRYLLLSSSRKGTQAANLQGIWNKEMRAYWSCNYTTNINLEMNYWPVEVSNLSECHMPLLDLIEAVAKNGGRVAEKHYGCKGWVAHHNLDIWASGLPAGDNGHGPKGMASCLFWPMGGVWLAHHLWEHYTFTMDESYLINTGYPLMKKAAEFCLDWLQETPEGTLVTNPSTSPENSYKLPNGEPCGVDIGTTSDMNCIYDLLTNCIEANIVLDEDDDFRQALVSAVNRLAPLRKGKQGELAEWSQDFEEVELGHRHVSHLYGIYPGKRISATNNADFLDAARISLQRRLENGGGGTGWALTWLISLNARLKQSENAVDCINEWLTTSVYDNLFDLHPPLSDTEKGVFQIDGNFGMVAGVAEMLIQSHNGYVEVLPALPGSWRSGFVKGLKARGAFELEVEWHEGKLVEVKVKAYKGGTCLIRYRDTRVSIEMGLKDCCVLDAALMIKE